MTKEEHLDMAAMQELKMVMADDFQLLIDTFVTDSQLRIDTLDKAVAGGDPEEIRQAAHSFKGSSSNIGALHLTALCKALEEAGREGELEHVEQMAADIKAEYEIVEGLLQEL